MDHDPIDLRAQEKARREEQARTRSAREQQIEDVKWLLKHGQGRRFIWRLLEKAGIYRSTFTGDAAQAAFLEGVRSVGLMVIADVLEADPDAYTTMLKEHNK